MADNAVQSVGKGPGNQTRVIVIMGGLIIVALVGVIIALVLNLNHDQGVVVERTGDTPQQRTILITEENVEEVVEELLEEEPVPMGYYEASMNMEWSFPNGTSPSSNAFVQNVTSNTNDVYFDLILNETGETLYASPVIPRGGVLRNFPLDVPLERGTYACTCTYHLIDDQQNTLSTLNMAVTVTVES